MTRLGHSAEVAQIATVHKFKGGTELKKLDLCAELELLLFKFG